MRTWRENETTIERLREWLAETRYEAQSLAGVDAAKAAGLAGTRTFVPEEPLPEIGFLQVVETLTALRQETKLHTKSQRGLQDAAEAALEGLHEATRRFESVQAKEEEAALRAALPLVEALAGLDEAMMRGMEAFEAAHRQMAAKAPDQLREELDAEFNRRSWWRRWVTRPWHERVRDRACEEIARTVDEEFSQLIQGYSLIRSRLARALAGEGVERVETAGRRVDPAAMTVVDLVDDPEAEPETVIEEVRPGYCWNGRVIRFAEVRAGVSRGGTTIIADAQGGVSHGPDLGI